MSDLSVRNLSVTTGSAPLGPAKVTAAIPVNEDMLEEGDVVRSEIRTRTKRDEFVEEVEKLWRLKTPSLKEMAELPLPDCGGHDCRECIGAFREFWVVKAKFLELRKALAREKQAMAETIEDVTEMEKDYEKRLEERRVELQVERERSAKLAADLEYERGLRMEDFYKAERAGKEVDETMDDMREYRAQMQNMGMEIQYLRKESQAFADLTRRHDATKQQLLAQISNYESQVNDLERANIDLRARAHKARSVYMELQAECDGLKLQLSRQAADRPKFRKSKTELMASVSMIDAASQGGAGSTTSIVSKKKGAAGSAGRAVVKGAKSQGARRLAQGGADAVSSLGQLAQKGGWQSNFKDTHFKEGSMFSTGPGLGAGSPVKSLRLGGALEDSMWSKII